MHNIKTYKMEKKEMKPVEVWRVGIQNGAKYGYKWAWSPDFESIDDVWNAYRDWFVSHPMTRIQFRKEIKYVPA